MVGGILSQSSQLFSQGIWMDGEIVDEQYGGVVTRIYVSHFSDISSEELEKSLSSDLAPNGVYTSVIEDEILLILGLIFAILTIFQAYLALGLIVGIAGIGVVTYRSVSERSGQIGMLRSRFPQTYGIEWNANRSQLDFASRNDKRSSSSDCIPLRSLSDILGRTRCGVNIAVV